MTPQAPGPHRSDESEPVSSGVGESVRARGGWATFARWAFYAAIAAAFMFFLWRVDWAELQDLDANWALVAIATGLGVAFRYLGVFVWRVVLTRLGAEDLPRFRTLSSVYAKAWLARYIPGTVPWLAGKVLLASRHGISRSRLAVSTLVEAAAQIVAVGAVSLLLLAVDPRVGEVSPSLRLLVAAGAVVGFAAMAPPVFNRVMALGFRLMKRGRPAQVGWPVVRDSLALYGGGALLSGLAYAVLILALVEDVSAGDIVYLVGAFGFAGVVGMLTPLVPAGVGTRDVTQYALLAIVLTPATAALIVLVSRVWSALVDLLFWAIAVAIGRGEGER